MINSGLDKLIRLSLEQVALDAGFSLPPIYRKEIYNYFAETLVTPHTARAHLDYLSVLKVYPLLEPYEDYKQVYDIDRIISMMDSLVIGRLSTSAGLHEADILLKRLEYEIDSSEAIDVSNFIEANVPHPPKRSGNPEFVIFAVVEALLCASGVRRFDNVIVSSEMQDSDFDIWSSDTARWAMLAYAGDELGESVNLERRKAFWLWWLQEAVPRAYSFQLPNQLGEG